MRNWVDDPIRRAGYHVGNVRTGLLDRARLILEQQGLAALNQRDLAAAAGVSIGTVYYHFDSKTSLLSELAADGFRELRNKIRCGGLVKSDHSIRQCGMDFVEFAQLRPELYSMMFNPQMLKSERVRAARDETFDEIKTIVKRMRTAISSEDELHQITLAVWACAQGTISLADSDNAGDVFDSVHAGMLRLFTPCALKGAQASGRPDAGTQTPRTDLVDARSANGR